MCTVTFIPGKDKVYLTSNRDEMRSRKQSFPPAFYQYGGTKLFYPKDPVANGTWIALHENGNAAVLLNGAFTKHIAAAPYKKSRGIILLDIISNPSPYDAFKKIALDNIEPFTLILWYNGTLYECRWDGAKKHTRLPDNTKPHIWSSVTLYNPQIAAKRVQWFQQWLAKNPFPSINNIVNFHLFAGEDDPENSLRMHRHDILQTLSITSIETGIKHTAMHYHDLVADKKYALKPGLSSCYTNS